MGRDRGTAEPRPSAPAAETGTRLTVVVVATVLVLAAIDAAAGPDLVLVGLILVGPCLAAVVGGRREVVAVSALVLALLVLLSWPDQLWWTGEQALYVVVGVSLTALSLVMVRMREESQRRSLAERQRTAALAAIVESSQDAVVGQSFDADITTWNRAAEELYGWRADEVVGRAISVIVPPERMAEQLAALAAVRRGEAVAPFETVRMARDGTAIAVSVRVSPVRDADGRLVGASTVARDVRALHAAHRELDASRTRMAALVESALDSIVVMDHHGDVVEFNPAAEQLFGYLRHEAVGHEMADLLVPPDQRQAHREGLARYLDTGEAPLIGVRLEVEATRADGRTIPVELTISRVDLPGDPLFLGHLRDLSEQRAAEAERDRLDEQLRQADRMDSLGQLSGGIAHDFNNVLAVILNYASLVQDELPEGPVREDVRAIHEAASRAAGLTRQLLDFSRSDPVTEGELVDVDEVVAAVGRLLGRTLPETIRLVVVPAGSQVRVRGVPSKIEQVVMNLAVNARDAMPDGGTVTITTSVRSVPGDEDSPPAVAPGRYVELAVADTGEGMSAGVRDHAFEPFFSTKPKGRGTGLGLATVYGIARQAGGTATIRSGSGQGTTVSVWLPVALAGPTAEGEERPDQGAAAPGRSGSVLVVEDEEMLGRALRRVLEKAGYSVDEARTAEEALEADFWSGPDLVVSDVTLPGMSGVELAARVRQLRPQVRVLLMSGYAEPAQPTADADLPLLVKPFSLDAFLALVDEVLGTVRDRSD